MTDAAAVETLRLLLDELRSDMQRAVAEHQRTIADLVRRLAVVELAQAPGPTATAQYMRVADLRTAAP